MQRKLLSWMLVFVALIFQCSSASAFDPGSWERAGAITSSVTLSVVSPTLNTIDSTAGSVTVTLPDAASVKGKPFAFKKIAGSNSVTLTRSGSDTLDGSVSISFSTSIQNQVVIIESDGTPTWRVLQNSAPPNGGSSGQVEVSNGAGQVKTYTSVSIPSNVAYIDASNDYTASQLPDSVNSYDLGSTTKWWRKLYLGDSGSNYAVLDAQPLTGNRIVNIPDADSTTVQPDTGSSNEFLTAISATGVISRSKVFDSVTYSSAQTLTADSPSVVYVSNSGSDWTLTLPTPASAAGKTFIVVKTDDNGNGIKVTRAGAIDSPLGTGSEINLNGLMQYCIMHSNGSSWHLIGTNKSTYSGESIALRNISNLWNATQSTQSAGVFDLGSSLGWWHDFYLGDASHYVRFTAPSVTSNRTFTLPDANCNPVQPDTGATDNFLTGISPAGVISKAQPSSSNLSDGSNLAKVNAGNSWSAAQVPSANTVDLGQDGTTWRDFYFKNNSTSTHKITGTTPTADRTHTFPDADTVAVQPSAAVSNQFITGITTSGLITRAQPSSANLSDGPFLANPMTTLGDMISGGASGSPARIVGNTTTTPKFLKSLGNGTTAAAPLFVQVDLADLSGTSNLAYTNAINNFTVSPGPSVDGGVDLGLLNQAWKGLYLDTNGSTGSVRVVTGTLTGARTCTLPDGNSNPVIPDTGSSNNFLTGISGSGVISKAQPSSSNLSDSSNIALRNNVNSWSVAQAPSSNSVNLGQDGTTWNDIYFKNSGTSTHRITATTPTADRTHTFPNANSNTVQPASGGTGQYVTGIDSAGVISFGTPSGGTSCDGRLTLSSNTPVTSSDVLNATNVYYCPYKGNKVAHSDGSSVYQNTFSQITISLSGKAANTNFDVVIYDSNGDGIDDTGELLQWTNNTTRATSITYSLGVPVKNGTVARTFVGTIRTTGTTGQCEDSLANRFVWNNSNRVVRPMSKTSSDTSWNYSTKTWRQMNGGTGSVQASFVTGLAEDAISATSNNFSSHSNSNRQSYCGIGLDSASTNLALTGQYFYSNNSSTIGSSQASYSGIPSIGSHTLYPLEAGNGSTTTTFYGSGSDAFLVPGITASYPM